MAARSTDLSQIRARLEAIESELVALDDDALPPGEWKERLHAWIDRQADEFGDHAAFGLSAASVLYNGHQMDVPAFRLPVRAGIGADLAQVDLSGFAAWLLREVLHDRIERVVEATDYPYGLPLAERGPRRQALRAERRKLWVEEEQQCRKIEDDGREAMRRADAQPEIVLAWDDELQKMARAK
ncbi:hypothetical protein [Thiorhodococcus minor]|uniref:Uncharacterized protein n=1 Tax=Thiorhodococcus minor TaxID=57489 RepID=A0A6M0JXM1_9GAMM|nr:hypothetical protein [Thiorhodococcus minor]NEV62260.1 hypothetical protein [Thiorhodococcus minor]